MKTVLVTGFEPFEGHTINVSWEIARSLDGTIDGSWRWTAHQLPCEFGRSIKVLDEALESCQPDLVLCLGQAEGRSEITLERIAINVRDARIPDNAGRQPRDEPIVADAPLAYASTLPLRSLLERLQQRGLPVSLSNSAGTFVCNEVFFALQHRLMGRSVMSGFVHLPILPEQVRMTGATVRRDDAPVEAGRAVPSLPAPLQQEVVRQIGQITFDLANGL